MKSKQLSIISRPRLADFEFFLDRQIDGDDLTKILTDAGMKLNRHRDKFDPDVPDDVWIIGAAGNKWVCYTADQNIERDYLDAICESQSRIIVLTDNQSGYAQWAAAIIASLDRVLDILAASNGPMLIRLSRHAGITRVRDGAALETRRTQAQTNKIVRVKRHGE